MSGSVQWDPSGALYMNRVCMDLLQGKQKGDDAEFSERSACPS